MEDYSVDSLFNNKILIRQSKAGYRYSLDPVLVSHFAEALPEDAVVDLGTGCGIIPIILSYRTPGLNIIGVEIQQTLFELAKENIEKNNLEKTVKIISADMNRCTDFLNSGSVDLVITNPPYTKKNSGRINPVLERAIARHEIKITLKEIVTIASILLKENGRFVVIYPEQRLEELLSVMNSHCLAPERVRFVYPKRDHIPRLVLVSGVKNGKNDCVTEPPLIINDDINSYSEEMRRMFD